MTQRIRLQDLALATLKAIPDAPQALKGLLNLALIRPESQRSIGLLIEQHARQRPDNLALSFEQQRWSYEEFNNAVNRYAHVLAEAGVMHGDRVAILMENRPETLMVVAATLKLGAIAGMLNHSQRGEVLAHSLTLLDAKLTVLGSECQPAWASLASPPRENLWWDGPGKLPKGFKNLGKALAKSSENNPGSTARVRASDVAFYIFTSGTTGMPKASRMSHYRWLRVMAGMGQATIRLRPSDVMYCCLPLYHNNALTVSWSAALGAGAGMALSRKFSASRFWDEARSHGATSFTYIGELCRYLLNQPAKANDREHPVRVIMGNGLRAEIWPQFEQRFGITDIREFYGASEGNAGFINAFGARGTAGFSPLSYAIVAFDADSDTPVRTAQGYLKKVAAGGVGLLLTEVTSTAPFEGYTDAKASEGKLLRGVFKKGDCWFNTGDLVRDQGYRHIQFVDRVGDTFRWKGENVSTTEVEGALTQCPSVAQAAVYGVEVPGHDGRAGMIAVTLAEGETFNGLALAQALSSRLPAYAVPLFVRVQAAVETTGTFKYRKVELKREGFNPANVNEPLYWLGNRSEGYQPLTAKVYGDICGGKYRL